jgi:hypothetical protein
MATVNAGYIGGVAQAYTTIAAAVSAATAGDTILVCDSTAAGNHEWSLSAGINPGKILHFLGNEDKQRVHIGSTIFGSTYMFNLADGSSITNLSLSGNSTNYIIQSTSTTTIIDRCRFFGSCGRMSNGSMTFRNCLSWGVQGPEGSSVVMLNCSMFGSTLGVVSYGGSSPVLKNCFATGQPYGRSFIAVVSFGTGTTNNAAFDGTAPGSNPVNLDPNMDYGIIYQGASGLTDIRGAKGLSNLLKRGGVDVGLTSDIDGQAYEVGYYPIGCSLGVYAEESASNILSTAAGTYQPVAVADVRSGTAVGVSPAVGSLAVPDPAEVLDGVDTDDTVGTFDEASRNTDPGEGNVEDGVTYKIANVSKEGTFAVPAEANVAPGIQYGASGTEFTGAFDVSATPDAPTITAIKAEATQVTLSITAGAETDTVYGRYRSVNGNGTWSAIAVGLTQTGSGDMVFDTLDDGVRYEFIVHAQAAGLNGDWSVPVFAEAMTIGTGLPATFDQSMLTAMNDKVDDLWKIKGLDAANPVVATGDGTTSTTLTVDGIAVTITPEGITRT